MTIQAQPMGVKGLLTTVDASANTQDLQVEE